MEKSKLIKYYFIETTRQGYFTISSTFDYEQVKDRARRQMGNYFRTNEAALGALSRIHDVFKQSKVVKEGISEADLVGGDRTSELVAMRVFVARALRDEGFTHQQIADRLKKDRTTIIYYLYHYKETEFYKGL